MRKQKKLVSSIVPFSSTSIITGISHSELWHIFHELDLDRNGQLEAEELRSALKKSGIYSWFYRIQQPTRLTACFICSGIQMTPEAFSEFMFSLSVSAHSRHVSFAEFRDFLLLLPRKASPEEIYRYYEVKRLLGDDGRGPARVTMEGK
jgi:solute carrier family 25 phosphate transporter 23/24/25/41